MNGKQRANGDAGHTEVRGEAGGQAVTAIKEKATNRMRTAVPTDVSGIAHRHLVPECTAGEAEAQTVEATGYAGFADRNRVRETIGHFGHGHVCHDGDAVITTNSLESGCAALQAFLIGVDRHAEPEHRPPLLVRGCRPTLRARV